MSFSRKNLLCRVKEVNELFVEKQRIGLSTEYIYRTFVAPRYHISRTTLYNWLTIPYKKQLEELALQEEIEKAENPTLFQEGEM